MIDFDVILKNIGGLGRYQLLIVLAVGSNSLHAGYNNFAPVFLNLTPDYRYVSKLLCNVNLTLFAKVDITCQLQHVSAMRNYNICLCFSDMFFV